MWYYIEYCIIIEYFLFNVFSEQGAGYAENRVPAWLSPIKMVTNSFFLEILILFFKRIYNSLILEVWIYTTDREYWKYISVKEEKIYNS